MYSRGGGGVSLCCYPLSILSASGNTNTGSVTQSVHKEWRWIGVTATGTVESVDQELEGDTAEWCGGGRSSKVLNL